MSKRLNEPIESAQMSVSDLLEERLFHMGGRGISGSPDFLTWFTCIECENTAEFSGEVNHPSDCQVGLYMTAMFEIENNILLPVE